VAWEQAMPPHDAEAILTSGKNSGQLTESGTAETPGKGKLMYCPEFFQRINHVGLHKPIPLARPTRWPNLFNKKKTSLENLTIGRRLTGFI